VWGIQENKWKYHKIVVMWDLPSTDYEIERTSMFDKIKKS